MDFQLNLSLTELRKRTDKEHLKNITFLNSKDKSYTQLNDNDKKILALLDKAGRIFDIVSLKQDNKYNLEFLEYLNKEIKKGNEKAKLTKVLFDAQKGMFSPDYEGEKIKLVKGLEEPVGLNFYPENLTTEEFHKIINKMLDEGKTKQVSTILSQRSMVRFEGQELVGIDYVDYFKDEFKKVADYLIQASALCDKSEKQFAKFLKLQAKALLTANPKLDAKADIVWARTTNSKFEFTITRECYDDRITTTILENQQLLERLKKLKINVYSKDCLGARVGLVNREGTELLTKLHNLNSIAEKYMPYKDKYSSNKKKGSSIPQTALDVDIVNLYGNEGEFRAGIVLAQNLPNNDKLSLKMGGGRKNVYHRQIRLSGSNKIAKKLLNPSELKYYNKEANHLGTICHENTHTLGPASYTLGKYSAIIEEFKADMGMFAFLDHFVEAKEFSETTAKEIIVSDLTDSFLKAKPNLTQAHRVRTVMILNRLLKEKAITLDNKNKLHFDFDKVISTAKIMMAELVDLQLSCSVEKAEKYINKYFKWTTEMKIVAECKKKASKLLNGKTTAPLSQELQKMKI